MIKPDFKKMNGLIPAIVQDVETKQVLMLAYVNEESYQKMLETKQTCFYSRSRQQLWHKGETSGHYQYIDGMYLDCDCDTLLIYVHQVGAACHTGSYSCFFNEIFPYDGSDVLDLLYDDPNVRSDEALGQEHNKEEALASLEAAAEDLTAEMKAHGVTPLELEQRIKQDHPRKTKEKRIFYHQE